MGYDGGGGGAAQKPNWAILQVLVRGNLILL